MKCTLKFEKALRLQGFSLIAGVDEAGRGPMAGPVVVSAVILPEKFRCKGLNDSKKLTPASREAFYEILTQDPNVVWAVAVILVEEIDRLNILRATHEGMRRAVRGLATAPQHVLIDGLAVQPFEWPQTPIVQGDGQSMSIAAASVIAKVTRDRIMDEIDRQFPIYGFARHKGYCTREHMEKVREHGPCVEHRRSFAPVAQQCFDFF